MISEMNKKLDFVLKSLSLLFLIFVFLGGAVIWMYLSKLGLGKEISSYLGSPQTLFLIAFCSLLILIMMILMFVFVPMAIECCIGSKKIELDLDWKNKNPKHQKVAHSFLIMAPIVILVLSPLATQSEFNLSFIFIAISVLMASLFYKYYEGPSDNRIGNKFKHYWLVFLMLIVTYGVLLLSLFLLLQVANFFDVSSTSKFIIFFLMCCIYSFSVALAMDGELSTCDRYAPITTLALVVVITLFMTTVSTNVVSGFGIGGYSGSYAVEPKYVEVIKRNKAYTLESEGGRGVVVLRNVWVVAELPNKLIFSANKESVETFSIPINAIINRLDTIK